MIGSLTIELIAWESENVETFLAELLMDLNHFFVVLVGQTSVCCDVHDHDAFLSFDQCLEGIYHLPIDVLCANFPSRFGLGGDRLFRVLKNEFSYYSAHLILKIIIVLKP